MNKLWEFINNRSPQKQQSKLPHIHEEIDLDHYNNNEYKNWSTSSFTSDIAKYISSQYGLFQSGLTFDQKIEFLDISSKSGIHLKGEYFPYKVKDYKNYLYFLHQKILNLGYVKNLAEVKSVEMDGKILTKYKYFLKPSLYNTNNTPNYGNITLEYNQVNEDSESLCIVINKHMDNRQGPIVPMEEFMNKIF